MYNMYNSFFSIIVAAVLLFFAFFAFHGLNSWEDESEERFERRKGQVKRFLIERIGSALLAIAFFAAIVLKMPVEVVFFLICSEELVKLSFSISRLKSCKWIKNVIN